MKRFIISLVLLGWIASLPGQQFSLSLQEDARTLLSSEAANLSGVLSRPQFAPGSEQLFAFVRQLKDDRYLYLYDSASRQLLPVSVSGGSDSLEISLEESGGSRKIYNDQLHWRPQTDARGRFWFVFVSNGREDNHDLYLGYFDGNRTAFLRLTDDPGIDSYPAWSPDGKQIAFTTNRSGNGDIYLLEDLDKVIASLDPARATLRRLTSAPGLEVQPAWNPNPKSGLLAYSERVYSPEEKSYTFQIRVFNLYYPETPPHGVTGDATMEYTRPLWNPDNDSQLLFVGQTIQEKDPPASLYLAELSWKAVGILESRFLKSRQSTEVFTNLRLSGTPVQWLPGGKALLVQGDMQAQGYPLFSVNIERWLEGKARSKNVFLDLHKQNQFVSGFDLSGRRMLFSAQVGKNYQVLSCLIDGEDLDLAPVRLAGLGQDEPPKAAPGGKTGRIIRRVYAGALVVGSYLLYQMKKDNGGESIGRPPAPPAGAAQQP